MIVLYILIFKFLDSNLENKMSAPNDSKHFLKDTLYNVPNTSAFLCKKKKLTIFASTASQNVKSHYNHFISVY